MTRRLSRAGQVGAVTVMAGLVPVWTAQAQAVESWYAEAGVSLFDGDGISFNAATLRGGAQVNDLFGVEVEGAFGISDETLSPGVEAELNQQLAGYVTARLPISAKGHLFTRLGYGSVQIRSTSPGVFEGTVEEDFDLDGAALGVGAAYALTDRLGLRADLTAFEGDEGSLTIIGVTLTARF